MTSILDHFAKTNRQFVPETTQQFFALQLARKLDDAASVRSYVDLAERYSEEVLVTLYRRALQHGVGGTLADRFRRELRQWIREEGARHGNDTSPGTED